MEVPLSVPMLYPDISALIFPSVSPSLAVIFAFYRIICLALNFIIIAVLATVICIDLNVSVC